MADEVKEFLQQWKTDNAKMLKLIPDAIKGFGGMFQSIMKDGALSLKEKELIALAIGLAVRCEPCIILHVQKCLDAGATREEILEAASVVIMMQGGPSFTHVPKVIEALEALAPE
jgi:AhpD family alkylhydroperoxidase